jgi:Bacterial SH3 domain
LTDGGASSAKGIIMGLNCKSLGAVLGSVAAVAISMAVSAQESPPPAAQEPPPAPPASAQPPEAPVTPPPQVAPSTQLTPSPQVAAPSPQAAPIAPGPGARSAFATANVNLRSGPGTDSEVLATIPGGSRVQITSCDGEWCAVTWNGRSGYAIARNLGAAPRQARAYRPPPGAGRYVEGPPVVEEGPPVIYGAPGYYGPPAVVYAPGYYAYGPHGYGGGYGWRRRW